MAMSDVGWAYLLLFSAIAIEVGATVLLGAPDGFTKAAPTIGCLIGYALSFALLARVITSLPVGMVYTIWSGVGTVAVVAISVAFLGEQIGVLKVLGIIAVIGGVILLHLGEHG